MPDQANPAGISTEKAVAACFAGDIDGAIAMFRALVAADYRNPDLHNSLGQLLLMQGNFREGLISCERRAEQRPMPFPLWRGEMLNGATVLLHGEQGFGDNIQFVRYATKVAQRGGRVVVATREGLAKLFMTVPGVAHVIEPGQGVQNVRCQAPMLSLPYIFATEMDSIPADVPYLRADAGLIQIWRGRFAGRRTLKVGIVWSGNTDADYNSRRSPGLAPFLGLMDIPGIEFFGLQLGGGRADLEGAALPANFTDLGPLLGSFDETAAAMMELDLVISSCTSPAHLAGALDRPLWVVLSSFADWRWFQDREDSPWYPSAKLFRQKVGEDWVPIFAQMHRALSILANAQK